MYSLSSVEGDQKMENNKVGDFFVSIIFFVTQLQTEEIDVSKECALKKLIVRNLSTMCPKKSDTNGFV